MIIGNKRIDFQHPPYFIADIASNHDGDLNRAFRLIELAKESGADAAKFQNFQASKIVSKGGFDSLEGRISHQKSWKKSVYEVYEECSINKEWTKLLKQKCDEVGIEYMTSPYDFESVDLADPYVNAFKIGSGDITWNDIIEYIAKKNKPVLLATGASSQEDVDRALQIICNINSKIILMQCNTNYTMSVENYQSINLNVLKTYSQRYPNLILGLSDHTQDHVTVLGAIALGARVIEKHFTDDNERTGPDHRFSLNPNSWKEMILQCGKLWLSLGDGIKKVEENEQESSLIQRRALYYSKNLSKGSVIHKEDLYPLRPMKENGIPPYHMSELVGKVLQTDVTEDSYAKWEEVK